MAAQREELLQARASEQLLTAELSQAREEWQASATAEEELAARLRHLTHKCAELEGSQADALLAHAQSEERCEQATMRAQAEAAGCAEIEAQAESRQATLAEKHEGIARSSGARPLSD